MTHVIGSLVSMTRVIDMASDGWRPSGPRLGKGQGTARILNVTRDGACGRPLPEAIIEHLC
jgi:hypothetical protein